MTMSTGRNIYFASDFHLGILNSKEREKKIVQWMEEIKNDASHLYLVGDLFDYWFEYKHVVPKGNVRFLSKIHDLLDAGIQIEVFSGNHDVWYFGYFEEEFGIQVHHEPIEKAHFGKTLWIGHGDGLGPADHGYKLLKRVFRNRVCQWFFSRLHPNFSFGVANYFSRKSRLMTEVEEFLGPEKEWLIQYCENEIVKGNEKDYFVFGHRHLPIDHLLSNGFSRYINLGDWIKYDTFAVMTEKDFTLKSLRNEEFIIRNY